VEGTSDLSLSQLFIADNDNYCAVYRYQRCGTPQYIRIDETKTMTSVCGTDCWLVFAEFTKLPHRILRMARNMTANQDRRSRIKN